MTARSDIWMPMYWGDYARDTGHLNACGHGAYLMLIKHYWCTGEPLADDDDELWRIACCDSKKEWLAIRPRIIRLFIVDGRTLRHKRIDRELANGVTRTEQRRLAGKASAGARKRQRESNERSTSVEDPLAVPLQRNGRQSQSQSQSQDSELRSDASASHSDLRSGAAAPPIAVRQTDLIEPDVPSLFGDGLAALAQMAGKRPDAMRSALGVLRKDAKDDALLLGLIREAETQSVVDPIPWLRSAIKARRSAPLLAVVSTQSMSDPWGVRVWMARQPDVALAAYHGEPTPCISGFAVEVVAEIVAEAAGLPETWRGSWDALADWMRADISMSGAALAAIRGQAGRMRSQGQSIGSIAVFDNAVRTAARSAA